MFYLGIDQHSKQLTVCLRDEEGSVVIQRQVSTKWERVREFFARLGEQCAADGGYVAVVEVWVSDLTSAMLTGQKSGVRPVRYLHTVVGLALILSSSVKLQGEKQSGPVDFAVRADEEKAPQPGTVEAITSNALGMKLTFIPAGEFLMGTKFDPINDLGPGSNEIFPEEMPQHRVKIAHPYYLGVTEVTQG